MRDTEKEAEGEAGSLRGARCGAQSQDPRIRPWAKGRRSTTKPPRCRGGLLWIISSHSSTQEVTRVLEVLCQGLGADTKGIFLFMSQHLKVIMSKAKDSLFLLFLQVKWNRSKVFLSLDYVLGILYYLHAQDFYLEPSTTIRTFT